MGAARRPQRRCSATLSYSTYLCKVNPPRALVDNLKALALFHELHNRSRVADCLDRLGFLALYSDLFSRAGQFIGASDRVRQDTGIERGFPTTLMHIRSGIPRDDPRAEMFEQGRQRGRAMDFDEIWSFAHDPEFAAELSRAPVA